MFMKRLLLAPLLLGFFSPAMASMEEFHKIVPIPEFLVSFENIEDSVDWRSYCIKNTRDLK